MEAQAADIEWMRVCDTADLAAGGALRIETRPAIAIFEVDGEIFAIDDTCTHARASLAEGYLDGAVVECPSHHARFCLRTGRALSPPARKPVRTYAVRVEDGAIYVGR